MGYAVKLQRKGDSSKGKIHVYTVLGTPWTGWGQTIRGISLNVEYIDAKGNSTMLITNKVVGYSINNNISTYNATFDLP